MKFNTYLMFITMAFAFIDNSCAQTDFTFTGEEQTYVVPEGVTAIQIEVWGAQGGGSEGFNIANQDDGGLGGYAKGTLRVNSGDELSIFVGGKPVLIPGAGNTGGFNGGGDSGRFGGAGGGASDVRMAGNGLFNRIIVAGGGGGGNTGNPDFGAGGAGGGLIGANGISHRNLDEPTGGTQSIGGSGTGSATNGGLGNGGTFTNGSSGQVAGGGGGLFGGGAGFAAGGAGGSSYLGGVSNGSTQSGVRSSNGLVRITETLTNATGSITAGDASYRYSQFNGNTSFRVGGKNVLFKDWWYYRISGDSREFVLPIPSLNTVFEGNKATLTWSDVDGRGLFNAQLTQVINQPNAGGATLTNSFKITNLTDQAMQFDLFHYIDIDIEGDLNDSAILFSGNDYISMKDNVTNFTAQIRAGGNLAYLVGGPSSIQTPLNDEVITSFNDSGLPFGPGDVRSGFQWSEFIPASASLLIESTLANGTATAPEPAEPIILNDLMFASGFE